MADRSVKVTLSAQVQDYVAGMERAANETHRVGSETEKLAAQRQAFEQFGRQALVAGGAIATGLGMTAKAAMDWDTAWTGVQKTVEGTPEQMDAIEQGLRDLTHVLPASHTEIAAVAQAAGQLGIETESVVSFTKTMIDLGESTNMSADQAATSLARFMNVMGTAQSEVSNLGAAVVDLGNNYATTESEIVEMAQRLAGAGAQVNMTEGEVLGLATALSSVGIEAQAGGTALSKVMIDIASSVDDGGERVEQFAQVAGMAAEDFTAQWRDDPGEALGAFVQGLANAEEQGKSTFAILEDLGISEIRMRDALLRSSAAADQFSDAMGRGNEAFEENVALTNEAEKRYETTAAKLDMMRNQVVDAAISLGQHLLPAIEFVAEQVGEFSAGLQELDGPLGAVVVGIGAITSAVLIGAGTYLLAVPKVAQYKVALETLGTTAQRTHSFISTLGKGAGLMGLAVAVAQMGSALVDWSAEASGTKAVADELEKSLRNTARAGAEVNDALAANSLRRFFDVDAAAVDNLRALNTLSGEMMANFESSQVGKVMTAVSSLGTGGQFGRAKENIEELDAALSSLVAAGNTEAAAEAQAEFAAKAKEAGWSVEDIAEALPQYQAALEGVVPPQKTAADAAADASSEYMDQASAAQAVTDEILKLTDALNEANGVAQDAEGANSRFQQTLADVEETVKNANDGVEGYSTSLDENTLEGAKNREMLAGLASDSQASAKATLDYEIATLGAEQATENYRGRLIAGREALIDQITALTGNRDMAEQLADQLYQIPSEVDFEVIAHTAAAESQLSRVGGLLDRISAGASGAIYMKETWDRVDSGHNVATPLKPHANGGIEEYADGGVRTGVYRGGEPLLKFAEPETGWEAFISGKPSERARNRQIWAETGQRLGMQSGASGTVYVPTSVTVVDADSRLIGTMDVRAREAVDDQLREAARASRKARF